MKILYTLAVVAIRAVSLVVWRGTGASHGHGLLLQITHRLFDDVRDRLWFRLHLTSIISCGLRFKPQVHHLSFFLDSFDQYYYLYFEFVIEMATANLKIIEI